MSKSGVFRNLSLFIIIGVVLASVFFVVNGFWRRGSSFPVYTLREGFTLTKNGEVLATDRPEDAMEQAANKGDVFTLTVELPTEEVSSPSLRVYAMHAILDAYVDNRLIYSYGVSHLERNDFIPQGYHLIPLPENYGGKTLQLQLTAVENNAFFSLSPVDVGNIHDLITVWVRDVRFVIIIGVFLVLFGFIMSSISLLMHYFEGRNLQMFAGGLVAINLGTFSLCFYNAFLFITRNLWWSTVIEYFAQFLLPVTITTFMRQTTADRKIRLIYDVCLVFSVGMLIAAAFLQITRLYPITQSLIIFQRLAIVLGVIIVYYGLQILRRRLLQFRRIRSSTASVSGGLDLSANMYLIAGLFIMLFTVLLDVITYQVTRYLMHDDSTITFSFTLIGMTVYALSIMLSYFYHGVSVTYDRSQSRRLEDLAYTDALTSLPNRAYCRRILDEMEAQGRSYCVISMDVNYLKEVNDTKGHAAGDELLKNFADTLRTSFRSSDIVGRLSGDEFIAILKGATLEETVEKARHMAQTLSFSISYGCAHSSEVPGKNAQEVYKLADRRMYEMKQEIHVART